MTPSLTQYIQPPRTIYKLMKNPGLINDQFTDVVVVVSHITNDNKYLGDLQNATRLPSHSKISSHIRH